MGWLLLPFISLPEEGGFHNRYFREYRHALQASTGPPSSAARARGIQIITNNNNNEHPYNNNNNNKRVTYIYHGIDMTIVRSP